MAYQIHIPIEVDPGDSHTDQLVIDVCESIAEKLAVKFITFDVVRSLKRSPGAPGTFGYEYRPMLFIVLPDVPTVERTQIRNVISWAAHELGASHFAAIDTPGSIEHIFEAKAWPET